MYNFFGFNILSKEEKEAKRREYESFVFPGREEQRREIRRRLRAEVPRLDMTLLMYFYISVKERMKREGISYEEAVKRIGKLATPPGITRYDIAAIKRIIEEDIKNEHDRYSES